MFSPGMIKIIRKEEDQGPDIFKLFYQLPDRINMLNIGPDTRPEPHLLGPNQVWTSVPASASCMKLYFLFADFLPVVMTGLMSPPLSRALLMAGPVMSVQ